MDILKNHCKGGNFKIRDLILGYVHINDIWWVIELSAKEHAYKSKIVTVNAITNNINISYYDVCKASKKRDVK